MVQPSFDPLANGPYHSDPSVCLNGLKRAGGLSSLGLTVDLKLKGVAVDEARLSDGPSSK